MKAALYILNSVLKICPKFFDSPPVKRWSLVPLPLSVICA